MNSRESKQHTDFRLTSFLADETQATYREASETFYVLSSAVAKDFATKIWEKQFPSWATRCRDNRFRHEPGALEYSANTETAQADLAESGIPAGDSSVDFVYSTHLRCQIGEEQLERIEEDAERVLKDTDRQHHRC